MGHIPSALSLLMITYELFQNENLSSYPISIGKTFGAQAWFQDETIRSHFISNFPSKKVLSLSDLTKSRIFGIYCQSELGIAASYAVGYSIGKREEKVLCILSDADVFFRSTIHAMRLAKMLCLNTIFIIDANNVQLFGKRDARRIIPFYDEVRPYELNEYISMSQGPRCAVVPTIKGYGCHIMEENPQEWHYRIMSEGEYEKISR